VISPVGTREGSGRGSATSKTLAETAEDTAKGQQCQGQGALRKESCENLYTIGSKPARVSTKKKPESGYISSELRRRLTF